MSKKKKVAHLVQKASNELLYVLGLLKALYELRWEKSPENALISIARTKTKIAFSCIEKGREILNIEN